ncbi:tetratricopeptide repeat protein, partial [Microcystis aeruginosa]|uniref:tetratricopeptide repeat protein n=1 Tax=Microcystis aeruginosa TaxID=1126 RepID=UPI00232A862A
DLGDYQGAIADYNQAINIKPDYALAYNNRGNAKYDLGDYQGAIADYNQAINIKPDYALAYYNRGIAKYDLGDYQGAIADYNQAAQLYSQQDNMEMYLKALDNIKNLEK